MTNPATPFQPEPNSILCMDDLGYTGSEPPMYHCSAELHLAALPPICALIHPFALRIAHATGVFSGSAVSVANYLGRDESTVRRGYKKLEKLGFFVKRIQGTFNPNVYNVLNHSQWAEKHPGQCVTKLEYHWAHENDPLGQDLWVSSGARVKWQEFQVKALRNLCSSDLAIVAEFEHYYQLEGQYKQARNVPFGFLAWLRRRVDVASRAMQ